MLNSTIAGTDTFSEYDSNDWIELFNAAATNLSLSGWYLSDDPTNLRQWAIPAVAIPAGGHLSFDEVSGFHNPITTGFGIDKAGEQVLLSHLPGDGQDRVVDAVQFKGQENGVSLGRYPDGEIDWFTVLPTRDAANTAPQQGIVVGEIMYHPPDTGPNDNTLDEYLELFNPTTGAVNFFNTNGAWRIDGGVSYTFPADTTLEAGGHMLIVNFDPADSMALTMFRDKYGMTNSAVAFFGPYSGKLGNRSDRIAIEKPQYPDLPGDPYSWVIVDEVIYGNQTPWPTAANGAGASLQRTSISGSGNNPGSWAAAFPTPGRGTVPDRDRDGLPDDWEAAYSFDPDDAADAGLDSDGDGLTNLQEYLSGTNPRDAASALKFESVSAQTEGVGLRFNAIAGRSYTVQARDRLDGGAWIKMKDFPAQPTNRLIEWVDAPLTNVNERYYRLTTPAMP